jgi:DNA-binding beta-propeller fold protein YncE
MPLKRGNSWLVSALVLLALTALVGGPLFTGWLVRDALAQEKTPSDKKPKPEKEAKPSKQADDDQNPFAKRIDVPEFPERLEWLNTGRPLTKKDLKGKFVILDFWTYCCINCMHILPELKKLEEKYKDDLVVIGVHSAKFDGEKDTESIRKAILRYEIAHPVINDAEHEVWNIYGVQSWPTIVLIDPEGKYCARNSGEFKAEDVMPIMDKAVAYYKKKGLLVKAPVKLDLEKIPSTPLRFPGKLLADAKSKRLFIADSNHNRIVIAGLDGKLQDVIGSGTQGKANGDFQTATFNHPQGLALKGDTLYVADNENHMLRKVDLKAKQVTTIAGDGEQAAGARREWSEGKPKLIQLNSPWDLWIDGDDLYIAMAGPHQIWKMPLDESEIGPYAGNGREDIVDGPLLPEEPYESGYASFAQPSGLTSDGKSLFVADSEGSSIRAVPLPDKGKEVTTVLGTSELRVGRLFQFGDVDGPKEKAQLQHCLAVAYQGGNIYVADTYNNKIKVVDAATGDAETIAGTGEAALSDDKPSFDQPAGLSIAGGKLYVADTNNHAVRVIDLKTKKVSTLAIEGLSAPAK